MADLHKPLGLTIILLLVCGLHTGTAADKNPPSKAGKNMLLTSSAFKPNGEIPTAYTCDGRNVSPPLAWEGVPEKAKSLVLIVDDPDAPDPKAPKMIWVHWVLYNLPPNSHGLGEAVSSASLPPGTLEGVNDWMWPGYAGPCPPVGRHRYFLKLYALDKMLPDLKAPGKAQVEAAMQGHIIATAELMGTYQRSH